eukprot:1273666-Amphidinium_carterae.1
MFGPQRALANKGGHSTRLLAITALANQGDEPKDITQLTRNPKKLNSHVQAQLLQHKPLSEEGSSTALAMHCDGLLQSNAATEQAHHEQQKVRGVLASNG